MSDFRPLPSYPGYSISPRGEVCNRLGVIFRVDACGRVSLRQGASGRRKRFFIGDLLAEAGFFISSAELEGKLKALARQPKAKGKPKHAADAFRYELDAPPELDFEDLEDLL